MKNNISSQAINSEKGGVALYFCKYFKFLTWLQTAGGWSLLLLSIYYSMLF